MIKPYVISAFIGFRVLFMTGAFLFLVHDPCQAQSLSVHQADEANDTSVENNIAVKTNVQISEPPVFSHAGGFYAHNFNLAITHPDPEVTIIYTVDGSEPELQNVGGKVFYYKNSYPEKPGHPYGDLIAGLYNSNLYSGPIAIFDRSSAPDDITNISSTWHRSPYYFPAEPVFKGIVVRAKAVKDGFTDSPVVTATYFVSHQGRERYDLPVISISLNKDALFDYEYGIYTAGMDFDQWRSNHPNSDANEGNPANYHRRGEEWEYPANLEFFEPDADAAVLNQLIGVRIHGGYSRAYPRKSFRLYARSSYGNSTFPHHVFPDRPYANYKRLVLRNSGDDGLKTNFRDALIQTLVRDLNFDTQAYRPAIVFINGEYWGILNIRERYDKHYLERVYGVSADSIDLLFSKNNPKEGDALHYNETIDFIQNRGLEADSNYLYIQTRIDVENFIDYQITNIFIRNVDWPGNNVDYWRKRTNRFEPDVPYGHDGRWRWLLYDTDAGLGGWGNYFEDNMLEFATLEGNPDWPNPDWSTFLLRKFLENEDFRIDFIQRFADLLNTTFLPGRVNAIINDLKMNIEQEMPEHLLRWAKPADVDQWEDNVEIMRDFSEKRSYHQRKHIRDFFGLSGMIDVNLNTSNLLKGHIRINTIEIGAYTPGTSNQAYPWNGKYFKGIPIEIEAIASPGYRFSHWEGSSGSTSETIWFDGEQDINLTAHFTITNIPVLLHYWMFNNSLANDTPLQDIDAFYGVIPGGRLEYISCMHGYPFHYNHPDWRKASLERRNNPTPVNYRPEGNHDMEYQKVEMKGIQVKQPFHNQGNVNSMIFHLPTTGFSDVVFRFAAVNENAADKLILDYNVSNHVDWVTTDQNHQFDLSDIYRFYEIDFSHIASVNNNPDFKIRIRFDGELLTQNEGNRVSFNNISLDGVALEAYTIHATAGMHGKIDPAGMIPVYEGSNKDFLILPFKNHHIAGVFVDGIVVPDSLMAIDENPGIFRLTKVADDHRIHVLFEINEELIEEQGNDIIIYPNPAKDRLTISALDTINKIVVTNIYGQELFTDDSILTSNYNLDTMPYKNGIYFLVIQTGKRTISKKFLVIR